jgi:hypothetical protein
VSTEENGKIIKWREEVFSSGPMVADMKANTLMTKRKAKEPSIGPMDESMMGRGSMASRME